jgi:cytochrome c556
MRQSLQSQTNSAIAASCRRLATAAIVLVLTAGWGFGQSDALNSDRVVEARQASMVLASVAMPVIAAMATGRAAYDPDRALVLSERIASLAATSAELFPPSSGTNTRSRTRASVWRDKASFDGDMREYVRLAATLAGAARARSLESLREPALKVAQACRSCHRNYADLD